MRNLWKHTKTVTGWFPEQTRDKNRREHFFLSFFFFLCFFAFPTVLSSIPKFKEQIELKTNSSIRIPKGEVRKNATFPKMKTHLLIQSLTPYSSLTPPISGAGGGNWIFKSYLQTLM